MTYLIYKLTSPSRKSYIGFTSVSLHERWKKHIYNWRWSRKNNRRATHTKLAYALDKYPPEQWLVETIYEGEDKDHALLMEMILIEQYNTVADGYNILPGGGRTSAGLKLSDEHKRRISEAKKGVPQTEEAKRARAAGLRGHKQSAETIEKRVSKIRGRPKSMPQGVNNKKWRIENKDGTVYYIDNLKLFCTQHNLSYTCLAATNPNVKYGQLQHKGYRIIGCDV